MKILTKFIVIGFLIIGVIFTSNCFAKNYVEDAKQYLEKGENKAAIIQLKNQLKSNPKDSDARFLLGTTYLKMGEIQKAEKELARASYLAPDNAQTNLTYSELLLAKRKYDKLRTLLDQPYSSPQDESRRLAYLGYAYLSERQFADAKVQFNQSNQQQENNLAYNGLAKIALFEKKYNLVESIIKKSLQLNKDNMEALKLKAKLFNITRDHTKALQIYNRLIEKNNKNIQLYSERIATYIALKQFENADNDIKIALKLSPNNMQVVYLSAQVSFHQQDFKSAQEASQKILIVKDNHFPSMLILGISHFTLQNYNQADKYLTQYLSVKPNDINAQNFLANVYLSQRKPDQALLMLESMDKDVVNSSPNLLLTMGSAYLLSGDLKKGVKTLNNAQALAPDNKEIKKRLVAGNLQSGDLAQAVINLENLTSSETDTKQYKYLLIVTYIQQKELDKAEKKLARMIQQDDKDPGLYNLRATIEKLNGNEQKAIENYNKALSINAEHIPAYAGLAQLALDNNQIEEAKQYYEKIILLKSDYIRAYISLASIAEKQNDMKQVEEILLKAYLYASDAPQKVRVATLVSKLYAKQNQPEKVIGLAKELKREYPDDISVMSFLAGAQIAAKQTAKAEAILKKIVAKNTSDVNHRILLANLLSDQEGKSKDVINLLDEVSLINPDNSKALMQKTMYLLKLQKFDEAMHGANQLIMQFPEQAMGQKFKGEIFLKQKKYKQALNAYQKAYQIQPENKILFLIVDLMKFQEQGDEGIALLVSELEKNKQNIGIHFKLASIYQQQKQTSKAIQHYEEMLKLQADNVLALNNLAGIYMAQNNPIAIQLAKRAYEKAPESAAIIDTYGYIQIKMSDVATGVELLEKAVSISPKSYDIVYHLAEGYALNGEKKKAKKILEPLLIKSIKFAEKSKAQVLFNKL